MRDRRIETRTQRDGDIDTKKQIQSDSEKYIKSQIDTETKLQRDIKMGRNTDIERLKLKNYKAPFQKTSYLNLITDWSVKSSVFNIKKKQFLFFKFSSFFGFNGSFG